MSQHLDPQSAFYEELPPAREGNRIFCHQEFLEKMEENRNSTVGRRAALLLQRLLVDVRRQYYKPTSGSNRGWRRSPLGGNHGNHFYAWWAPRGAAPLKGEDGFDGTPEGSVFLRDIRHHDDHRPLGPQSLDDNYLAIGVKELRSEDYVRGPWTPVQARFADARQKIRIVKGFPGSGKTTALWHAADLTGRESILYITYSADLAALARDHFDKFAPGHKHFHVTTYAQLLREVLETDAPFEPVQAPRRTFAKEISGFSPSILGPWLYQKAGLYDEIHAHLFGAMFPFPVARFAAFPDRRMPLRQFRELREHAVGRAAADAVIDVCDTLRRRDPRSLEQRFFFELDLAWRAVQQIQARGAGKFAKFDCIALDEAQDLTPLEALVIIEMAKAIAPHPSLLVAGDEAQTVRPTDFEWGWFQDLVHHRLGSPMEFRLQVNLRSPKRIAMLVNRVWDLYGAIAKHERPGGGGAAEIDENAGDQVVLCSARGGPELDELLEVFSEREGLALITMGEEIPAYVPERLRGRVLTTFEAKGLDFQSVCLLEGGKWLDSVLDDRQRGRGVELQDLSKRLAIDQLRVALSRPSERLYWLDVNPTVRILSCTANFLAFGETAYPVVPAVLLKSLEEESLEAEERVKLCEADARQFLEVKPALAWSRARQAVALLGEIGSRLAVSDPAARQSAHMTLCQVAFTLAFRKTPIPAEMGLLEFFGEASTAARAAGRPALAAVLTAIGDYERNYNTVKFMALFRLAAILAENAQEIEPWLLMELQPRAAGWIDTLEQQIEHSPDIAIRALPTLLKLFAPQEAEARAARVREKSIRALMRLHLYDTALAFLALEPNPNPKLVAECHEGRGQWETAAEEYLKAGSVADALHCYRSIPDFDKSLELLDRVGQHPARDSLVWLRRMRDLAAERPAEFNKVMLPAEKKLLEAMLEKGLGVSRRKPAVKKAVAAKKSPAVKKPAAKKPGKKGKEYF